MIFCAILGVLSTWRSPAITPYRSSAPIQARSIKAKVTEVAIYEPVEVEIDLSATYDNPFDPSDISVNVRVDGPNKKGFNIPAYFTIDQTRKLTDGKEVITPTGKPSWRAKITLRETGIHQISAIVKDRNGSSLTDAINLNGLESEKSGFVSISSKDIRYFLTSEGKSFYPLGTNVCWGGDQGTFNYDNWIPKYADQGCNVFRVWLSPYWATFGLEQTGNARDGKGLGVYSLENLSKLDHVLDLARSRGMKVKLCIESYNIIRDKDASPSWEEGPHSIANGGVLHTPSEFWESNDMDRIFMAKLRYLVARYSADPAVFAWEFFNEADLSRDFPVDKAKEWHQRMAKELRLLDPYKHLITTSFSDSMGVKEIDLLSDIDYIQTHNYNSPDVISQVAIQQSRKGSWGKPHYVGEIGADSAGPRREDDPTGIQIHDPMWISIAMGSSGVAQSWWWDNLIEPNNLYPLFGAASKFLDGINWPNEGFRQTQPRSSWRTAPNSTPRKDISFQSGIAVWEASPYNQPRTVKITEAGATGQNPVANTLHGLTNHRSWHNPVTFRTELPRPTVFEVTVDGVSGYGGGRLVLDLDGSPFLTRNFPDPDGSSKTETLSQYNGTYKVTIPPGKHTLIVKNTGDDWINASMRFKDVMPRTSPPLISWGTIGDNTALAWTRLEDRTWRRVCVGKETIPACPETRLELSGLASGTWKVELWDTWKGTVRDTQLCRVTLDGKLKVNIPTVESDIAMKATRQPKG
jgi:hypothetical protein